MTDVKSSDLSLEASAAIAVRVREELARRRMSRRGLADLARISLSTLEKALNGSRPFTLATVVRLEQALSLRLRGDDVESQPAPASAALATSLGAYTPEAVKWLEGDYLTLRPSFEIKDAIFAYRTLINWDADQGCLAFREAERQDAPFSQRGVVSVPNKSGHVYLHTNTDGQLRLAILGRPLIGGEMYGLLATLHAGMGTQLMPVSVPIALIPSSATPGIFGRVLPGDGAYDVYRGHLDRITERGFAKFPMP